MSPSTSSRPSTRASAFMLALAVFGPGLTAACADDATPAPAAEPATEDSVTDDE